MARLWDCSYDSICVIYIYQIAGQAASVGGTETLWPAAGLQFIDWVSVDDI